MNEGGAVSRRCPVARELGQLPGPIGIYRAPGAFLAIDRVSFVEQAFNGKTNCPASACVSEVDPLTSLTSS
jgi:hypothetical protein